MGKGRITKRAIDTLRASAARDGRLCFLWDTDVRGFAIKASPTGVCAFLVQKTVGGREGKDKRISLGQYPSKTIDRARKEAGEIVSDVHKGLDVAEARRQTKVQQKERLATELEAVFDTYARKNKTEGRYWHELENSFRNFVIPDFGKKTPVGAITKRRLRALIDRKQPGAARSLFAALRPFFKWCVEQDIIAASPMDSMSPPAMCEARDRKLSERELRVFWQAAESMGYPFGPFYQLLLLTAQRRDEVAGLRRSEIDTAKGEWIIPKERTKNGKEHLVHLSPQALSILSGLPDHGPLLFTTNKETAISGFSKAKTALDSRCASLIDEQSGNFSEEVFDLDWRVHDLRRTAASGMAELGFQPHIVERVLNHVSGAQGGLVGVYQRFEYAEDRKRALLAWSNRVSELVSGAVSENQVIDLTQRKNSSAKRLTIR